MKEKVSVIIPTYKRPDYLCNAVDSVLAQTYENIEIIVVDDNGSSSEYRTQTADLMKKYSDEPKVIYLPLEKNCGGAAARNAGIDKAIGDYIAFLDDDDVYLPQKIEVQLGEMKKNGWEVSVMDGATYNENEELLSRKIQKLQNGMTKEELLRVHLMYHITNTNTFMFKAEALRKIGGFTDIVACQEYMLMMKTIRANLKLGYINQALVKNYIRSGERLSSGKKKYTAQKIMYKTKKECFYCLSFKERRYVTCRHYGVLFYVQLKQKKYFSAFAYLALSVLSSPQGAWSIYKDYKGKLTQ